jgi:hypothetical protein
MNYRQLYKSIIPLNEKRKGNGLADPTPTGREAQPCRRKIGTPPVHPAHVAAHCFFVFNGFVFLRQKQKIKELHPPPKSKKPRQKKPHQAIFT